MWDVGLVDIFVNNVGIMCDMMLCKFDKVNWDVVICINFDFVFNMMKLVCDGMVECGWGCIVNILLVNGLKGLVG